MVLYLIPFDNLLAFLITPLHFFNFKYGFIYLFL
nr:MAG TPA: hypothetical protein [Caudoviricetes sp.]